MAHQHTLLEAERLRVSIPQAFRQGSHLAFNFIADHLRPAAKAAGVQVADGQRLGLHNFRHSLATFLSNGAKIQPKTVQGILRHADIKTTLGLYTQDNSDEKQAAQGAFLDAMGLASSMVQ